MGQKGKRRITSKIRQPYMVVGLLVLIAALLAVVITLLPEEPEQAESTTSAPISDQDLGETITPDEERDGRSRLYVIIDDVGNNLQQLEGFLQLPFALSFAVMPERPFSEEAARRILASGHDIILHQPMEPVGEANPGEGAITTAMDRVEIQSILERNVASLPGIKGISNHMGSKATADREVMQAVLEFIEKHDFFYIDSVTTENIVGEQIADELRVEYAKRNTVFLDNHGETSLIRQAILAGTNTAKEHGSAIMIGHVQTAALAGVLSSMYAELCAQGFTFGRIQDYQFN